MEVISSGAPIPASCLPNDVRRLAPSDSLHRVSILFYRLLLEIISRILKVRTMLIRTLRREIKEHRS